MLNTVENVKQNETNGVVIEQEKQPEAKIITSRVRWYILLIYCLTAFTQAALWNTWGPISASAEHAFGWKDSDIALLPNWGPIAYILATFFFSWVVDVKGLRWACLLTILLSALGAAIRCITDQPPYVKWTVNIGQLLNGLAGPIAMGGAPALSAVWFPVHERTTATAIATVVNSVGVGISFLIGPYMVPEIQETKSNTSIASSTSNTTTPSSVHIGVTNYSELSSTVDEDWDIVLSERKHIMLMMYVECAWTVLVLLLMLIYFPAKPPHPPTITASIERVEFKSGVKKLFKNKGFWIICLTYGGSLGVFNCWQGILDVVLKPHGISQVQAGWLGFYSIMAGAVSAVIVARFADIFSRHTKLLLVLLYIGGSIAFTFFTLLVNETLPSSAVSLYVSIILGTLLVNTSVPLYFEMGVELSYPVAEGVTNLVLTFANNIAGLIFLAIQMIPNIGTSWQNWTMLASLIACIPILLLLNDRYNRLNVDENVKPPENDIKSQQPSENNTKSQPK